jgi:hypothetical protein
MKYKNIKELSVAFKNGLLEGYVLCLDNDFSFLKYAGKVPSGLNEEDAEIFRDNKTDEAYKWFKGKGNSDLLDVYKAAGIPAEWV